MIILVMGVTGAGKTTIGSLLPRQLGWEFVDADSFHSPENVEKIRQGIALSDADRAPWLRAIRDAILKWIAERKNVVLTCSALKREYREELVVGPEVKVVYLKGSYELISSRLRARHGHFATEKLLASQFETLEEPRGCGISRRQPRPGGDCGGDSAEVSTDVIDSPIMDVAIKLDLEAAVIAKLTRRLLPFLFLLYIFAFLHRIYFGFSALQMQKPFWVYDVGYGPGAVV